MNAKKTNKKSILLLLLVLALAVAAIAGTVAWLTDTDTEVNTFTVGAMDEPEVGPTNPTLPPEVPTEPGQDPDDYNPNEDGYIFEPWYEDMKEIAPGGDYAKDPYVGVGADSDAAYIFVEVENNFKNNSVYFKLNAGWSVVEATPIVIDGETYYAGGIFTYDSVIGGEGTEAWTSTPVFSYVTVSDNATYEDLAGAEYVEGASVNTTMVINAFIHQAKDGNDQDIAKSVAQSAAVTHFTAPVTP